MLPPPMRRLRALFLDVDDTLYSTSEFAATARRAALDAMIRHGLRMPLDDAVAELAEVIAEFGSNYPHHYDRLLRRLPIDFLPPGNPAILVAAAVGAYHDTKYRSLFPFRDVPEVLAKLSASTDLTIGVITEGLEIKQAEKLVRLGLTEWIARDAIFISDQIGISKPNRKLYLRACASTGVEPPEAMYVGDHPENDIAPAKSIGMVAVRHRWQGGKHAREEGGVKADYEIRGFQELIPILRDDFGFSKL
jgi:putative hydrolase of the HAD superfamily